MSKNMFWIGFFILVSHAPQIFSQNVGEQVNRREALRPPPASSTAIPNTANGKVFDEGQVQVPVEGHVENIPQGHVEAINPVAVQRPVQQQKKPESFQFERETFKPIPSP